MISEPIRTNVRDAVAGVGADPHPPGLSLVVHRSFDGLDHLRTEWDAAVEKSGANICMTYDWTRIWWKFYGRNGDLRIFVFRQGASIISVLPIYVERLGFGPLAFRVARLVGANIPPKVFDPPVPAEVAGAVFDQLLEVLFGGGICDLLSFGPFSGVQKAYGELIEANLRRGAPSSSHQTEKPGVHTLFHLPATLDEYLNSLPKTVSKRRKYEMRALTKDHQIQEDVVRSPGQAEIEFEAFATQHAANWSIQGKPGHFGSWPAGLEYHRQLVSALAKLDRVRIYRIIADGEVVSRQYDYVCGKKAFWDLPSRAMGERWDKLSLGQIGLVSSIELAIQEGIREMEAGIGHYEYKLRLGAEEHPLHTIQILRPGVPNRTRKALWRILQRGTYVAYQALWYRRIAPKLPLRFRRPQPHFALSLDY
jgi:CelD/BcsL family acetyltransferase involved in cellulose biosynthesis